MIEDLNQIPRKWSLEICKCDIQQYLKDENEIKDLFKIIKEFSKATLISKNGRQIHFKEVVEDDMKNIEIELM